MEVIANQEVKAAPVATVVDPLSWKDQGTTIPPSGAVPQPPAAPATPAAPAAEAAVAAPTPQVTPQATPQVEVPAHTPAEAMLAEMAGTPAAATPWTDEAKALFKGTFEAEDPIAFRDQYRTEREQYSLLKQENEKLVGYKNDFESLSPAMLKAIELQKAGKDPLAYLKTVPDAVFQNKPSAELSDEYLCTTYAQGKTDSAFNTLKDPDATPEQIQAAKDVIGHYRSIGADKHDQALAQIKSEYQAQQQQQAVAYEQFQKGTAVALSNVKGSPQRVYVDQARIEEFTKPGVFLSGFLEADGVTPKPDAFIKVIKGERFDEAVAAARDLGYKQGKQDGIAEGTSQLPTQPGARREVPPAPNQQTKQSANEETLDRIQASIGR